MGQKHTKNYKNQGCFSRDQRSQTWHRPERSHKDGQANSVPDKLERETQRSFPQLWEHHSRKQKLKIKKDKRPGCGWNYGI